MTQTWTSPGVLDWLDEPRNDRGVSFQESSEKWHYVSYAECAWLVNEAADKLVAAGVRPADVVACVLPNGLDFTVTYNAVLLAGATPCPLATPAFGRTASYQQHLTTVLRTATPSVVVTTEHWRETVREAADKAEVPCRVEHVTLEGEKVNFQPRTPADIALLQFTSGSSGAPRGVRVSWENLAENISRNVDISRITSESKAITWLPMFHDMGLIGTMLTPARVQADLLIMQPEHFIMSPLRWLQCFSEERANISVSPCFGYEYASRKVTSEEIEGFDFSEWHTAIVGSDRVDPTALTAFFELTRECGFRSTSFVPAYGLAEATLSVTAKLDRTTPPSAIRLDWSRLQPGREVRVEERKPADELAVREGWLTSCGEPHGAEVAIVDDSGCRLQRGVLGEICLRGRSVAEGYHGDPESSSAVFTRAGLRTGDAGFMLDGELYVIGRVGDSMQVRGRTVYMEDVEEQACASAGFGRQKVVAFAGPTEHGAQLAVLVEKSPGEWVDSLAATVARVCGDEVDAVILSAVRGTIRRTSSGKPRRRELWREYFAGELAAQVAYRHTTDLAKTEVGDSN